MGVSNRWIAILASAAFIAAGVALFRPQWLGRTKSAEPAQSQSAQRAGKSTRERNTDEHAEHDHDGHDHPRGEAAGEAEHQHDEHLHDEHDHGDHEHAGHDEAATLELTPQALKNIDYKSFKVTLGDYARTISLPGMVVERPGKTQLHVSAPLGGVVTRVHILPGEAVGTDAPLFDIRLTHEELVSAQGEFLKTTEELDVIAREIARLEALTEGVVAGNRLREQKYQRQKLEASQRAQRQALLLHGLSEAEVDEIIRSRRLLQSLTIRAPEHEDDCDCGDDHLFHVQSLSTERGQQVEAGAPLAILADHCELYIEGTAFEEDAEAIRKAAADGTVIAADLLVRDRREEAVGGLKILYLADQVDRDSRAFHFYVTLPNSITLDRKEGEHRFLQWRFKPGQRVDLRIPVERWEKQIVLPAEAVVGDGAESYVFLEEGMGHFHRLPVHVRYRDAKWAVVENDGAVHAGDRIAGRGAFQMQLDLKNKAGGGVDPHAGHSH